MAHLETHINNTVLAEMAGGSENAFRKVFDEFRDFVLALRIK